MSFILNKLFAKKGIKSESASDLSWIDELPHDNPLAGQEIILRKMARIAPADITSLENWQIRALLLVDTRCQTNIEALEQQYASIQKMRPEEDTRIRDALNSYYRNLVRGYQAYINGYTEDGDQASFNNRHLPLVVARAIHNFARIARLRYLRYLPMPDGGWLALHKLYGIAERKSFADRPIRIYENLGEMTPGEIYAQALMFDTINFTNMTKAQINLVNVWLAKWIKGASLENEFNDKRFLFYVDLEQDRGARRIRNFKARPSCRYWETDVIYRHIEVAKNAIEIGRPTSALGLGNNFSPADCEKILPLLLTEWSRSEYQRQRRKEERQDIITTVIITNGFSEVWQQVRQISASTGQYSGDKLQLQSQSLDDRLKNHTVAYKKNDPIVLFAGMVGERWMICDESPSGFGAIIKLEQAPWVKLGRLVALVKEDNRRQVALGIIRNIKQETNGRRHIGIEVITRESTAVRLTDRMAHAGMLGTGDAFGFGLPEIGGLLIPPVAEGESSSVVIPFSDFNHAANYEISYAHGVYGADFGEVIEQSDDWIRLTVQLHSSSVR